MICQLPIIVFFCPFGILRCRWGDVQCCTLSTQTTQDSPGAEPRRSRRNWGRSLVSSSTGSWYSSKHTDWSQAPKLVTGTQTGCRHPSFRTKHNKTRSLSPRRLIPPDIGTHSWSSLWRLIQLQILSLKILGPSLLTDNSEIWEGGFFDSNRSRWYCT